jgi:trk system potassium uptake protein TrkA
MKVTIVGAGKVGVFLAKDLTEAGHQVLVIERDDAIVAHYRATIACEWLVGDGCELATLETCGLNESDVLVAVTGDDEDNLVVSLLAKQEYAIPRVIARVNHPKNHWLFTPAWGVDVAVSTPHLISSLVEEAVSVGAMVSLLQFSRSGARLVEVTLATSSPALGRTIEELELPRSTSIVAVIRKGEVQVPRGDTVLTEDDEVICLVTEDDAAIQRALIGAEPSAEHLAG